MTSFLNPVAVREALDRMNSGDASEQVLNTLVAAAEEYAQMSVEWGFESNVPGMTYSTRNDMLIETMSAAKPDAIILARIAPDWQREQSGANDANA